MMNTAAIKKTELMRVLSQLPDEKLDAAASRLTQLLKETEPAPKRVSLSGIWRGKGFEAIEDVQGEFKIIESDLNRAMLNRPI